MGFGADLHDRAFDCTAIGSGLLGSERTRLHRSVRARHHTICWVARYRGPTAYLRSQHESHRARIGRRREAFLKGVSFIASFSLVWAGYFVLFVFLPNTKVKWRPALFGALITAILWTVAQWAYIHFQY